MHADTINKIILSTGLLFSLIGPILAIFCLTYQFLVTPSIIWNIIHVLSIIVLMVVNPIKSESKFKYNIMTLPYVISPILLYKYKTDLEHSRFYLVLNIACVGIGSILFTFGVMFLVYDRRKYDEEKKTEDNNI